MISNTAPPGNEYPPLVGKVWGKMACFTRPEAKAERVSYPVMTPSAARGVLEAIYWKPEFSYRVRDITVLAPIRYSSIFRNEVDAKASPRAESISITDARQQRHTLLLRGLGDEPLSYIIRADAVPRPGVEENPAKFRDIFRRRVADGQCFHRPYLGCREFACDFAKPDSTERVPEDLQDKTVDLGMMLLDIAYGKNGSGVHIPYFWQARLENGVLRVPDSEYDRLEALRL
ncbi:MAG: type I-C CRISPR-associated protein Cas5 [Alphaproteobacteria bacterium]|nr:MAG: type I-C CRISPR-associated protein Cas5 [Alphaproteobacteria bacterium]